VKPIRGGAIRAGLGLAVWLAGGSGGARAGETPPAPGTNQPPPAAAEVVVTATRMARAPAAAPARVTVLDAEFLRAMPAFNPDDQLRAADGVSVLRSYGLGYGIPGQINVRGVPGQHGLLMLADGLPLNEAATGFINPNEVPEHLLERMELVRGPYSALYGADAFAGVVQLFTLDAAGPAFMEAAGRAGNEGFGQAWATLRQPLGEAALLVAADARSIANYTAQTRLRETFWDPASQQYLQLRRAPENYDYADLRLLGKLAWSPSADTRLELLTRGYDGNLGYGQTAVTPDWAVDNESDNRSALLAATVSSAVSETLNLRGTLAYRRQKRTTTGLDRAALARSVSESVADEWRAESAAAFGLGRRHALTVGADYAGVGCDFRPAWNADTGARLPSAAADAHTDNLGVYVQDEAALHEQFLLTAALRGDAHSEFGGALSPKLAGVYRPAADTIVRAAAGRAYRAPSVLELFQPDVNFGSLLFRSNPDLEPEYIWSADAGVEQGWGDGLRGHVEVFWNEMDDLIARRVNGAVVTYENVDEARSQGLEAGLDAALDRWLPGVAAFVNGTRQQSEDRRTGADLPYLPERMGNIGLRFERAARPLAWSGSVRLHYTGERGYTDWASGQWRTLDGYWRTDALLKATHRSGIWVAVAAQNLADTTYQESSTLDPAPGRLWYVEAGLRL